VAIHARKKPAQVRNPHPTVKPLELMRWLVWLLCPPGGLVLDPTAGSGTTGAAAALEGRRFLGIEPEPAYIEIAAARIAHHSKKAPGRPKVSRGPLGRRRHPLRLARHIGKPLPVAHQLGELLRVRLVPAMEVRDVTRFPSLTEPRLAPDPPGIVGFTLISVRR
jgi:hypothetical protein